MFKSKNLLLAFILIFAAGCSVEKGIEQSRVLLTDAEQADLPIPLISSTFPAFRLDDAYRIQSDYVGWHIKQGWVVSGYKAGLTSVASQTRFNAGEPVAGVLFAHGERVSGSVIDSKAFGKLMLEAELGFITQEPIRRPVSSVDELKKLFSHTLAVVELPDLGFADLKQLKVTDIVAANVAARQYIIGVKVLLTDINPNDIEVSVYHDGKRIITGEARDAMGDQWQALLWLVNNTLSQGYNIHKGAIFITGALGKMAPGTAGNYQARFGALGILTFSVQ